MVLIFTVRDLKGLQIYMHRFCDRLMAEVTTILYSSLYHFLW